MKPILKLTILSLACSLLSCENNKKHWYVKSDDYDLRLELVADSIAVPFGIAFLPSGEILASNRPAGQLIKIDPKSGHKTFIKGVPSVWAKLDGGMLDVLPHPDYANNGWLYYSYSTIQKDSTTTLIVERAKLKEDSLVDKQTLFTALPYHKDPSHFGTRLLLSKGYLFFTMGEHNFLRDSAQLLGNHLGKVLRIYEDGRIPEDNPFVNNKKAKPEVWSYGHRNPQGLALHPASGELWEHEHGPKGGDEINIVTAGLNYGWPVICYGVNYDDTPVGAGITEHEGMEQPIHYYKPSIAPSGMLFYTGDEFPKWKGNLFIGALALRHLNRLVMDGKKVVHEERLFLDEKWRVRSLAQGPDGFLYIGVDGGMILKICPR
ncbi:PQQ-dependent sugar dehydrogenase [soil metagenome]